MHKAVSNPTFQSRSRSKTDDGGEGLGYNVDMGKTYTILSTSPRPFELSTSPSARQLRSSPLVSGRTETPPPTTLEIPYDPDTGMSSRQEFRVHYANPSATSKSTSVATVPPAPRKTPEMSAVLQHPRSEEKLAYEPFGVVDNQRNVRLNSSGGSHVDPSEFVRVSQDIMSLSGL